MIIRKVRSQGTTQRFFTQDNHMVQALATNRANDAFDVSSLPGRSRSAENFLDIHYRDLIAELLPIDAISISQQISGCRIKGKPLEDLLARPFGCRVRGNVKMDNTSSIMRKD